MNGTKLARLYLIMWAVILIAYLLILRSPGDAGGAAEMATQEALAKKMHKCLDTWCKVGEWLAMNKHLKT